MNSFLPLTVSWLRSCITFMAVTRSYRSKDCLKEEEEDEEERGGEEDEEMEEERGGEGRRGGGGSL